LSLLASFSCGLLGGDPELLFGRDVRATLVSSVVALGDEWDLCMAGSELNGAIVGAETAGGVSGQRREGLLAGVCKNEKYVVGGMVGDEVDVSFDGENVNIVVNCGG
jgi:hypothetical protein